jgi:membrane-bound lytic murein transglycosylase D
MNFITEQTFPFVFSCNFVLMKKLLFVILSLLFILKTSIAGNNDSAYYSKITDLINSSKKMYYLTHSTTNLNTDLELNDFMVEYNIAKLNETSAIELYFDDDVKKWITFYVKKKPELTKKIVELSSLYFPLFEKELDKYNLPLELRYIPVIESSLNPNAKSRSGAVGLWQFLYETGKLMNLKITSFIDERKDPYKSTEAACNYFKYLYNIFDDWLLAIAAYNCGPTTVKNAIQRSGGKKNFYVIKKYLPQEAQQYVPKFIAANYFMNFYNKFGISPDTNFISYFDIDTILTTKPVRFDVLSHYTDVPIEIIKFLNPLYSKGYKPASKNKERIVLPKKAISHFIKNEDRIYMESVSKKHLPISKKVKIIHTVKKGEYMHLLELKYKVSAENIRKWNNLKSDVLFSNQKLIIWVNEDVAHMLNAQDKEQ